MSARHTIYTFFRQTLYSSMSPPRRTTAAVRSLRGEGGAIMRIALLATALSAALVGLAVADPAFASIKATTDIAPQELSSALRQFASFPCPQYTRE